MSRIGELLLREKKVSPQQLAQAQEEAKRTGKRLGAALTKLGYIKDLAEHVETGTLPLDEVEELDDDEVLAALVAVKGVGRWTAQMFLMFRLGRPDVFPELDLGIQKGVQRLHGLDALPAPRRTAEAGEAWRPYRTVAAWYLWRSLE